MITIVYPPKKLSRIKNVEDALQYAKRLERLSGSPLQLFIPDKRPEAPYESDPMDLLLVPDPESQNIPYPYRKYPRFRSAHDFCALVLEKDVSAWGFKRFLLLLDHPERIPANWQGVGYILFLQDLFQEEGGSRIFAPVLQYLRFPQRWVGLMVDLSYPFTDFGIAIGGEDEER